VYNTAFEKWLKFNYGLKVTDLNAKSYSKYSREYNNEYTPNKKN
tara:strand:- start:319 stop:450 length:132 start_codon:yes stop_codon:yes gene_type:complete